MPSTDFYTTNLVDINWTVTVIIKLWLPPKLLMIPLILPPAHCHGRGPLWGMDTNFRRAGDFSIGQKAQFLPTTPAFGAPFGVILLEFCRSFASSN